MTQGELFTKVPQLPTGLRYEPQFLTVEEEAELLAAIEQLPLEHAQYKQFTANRRIVTYGSYDFSAGELKPAGPVPPFLHPLRERIAEWAGIPARSYSFALIAEYSAGTQLGWHRDVPDFEAIAGVSLRGKCRMRLRPYPPQKGRRDLTLAMDLEPRSAYSIVGQARWGWQHAISPTKELRYSITFRTRRDPSRPARAPQPS
jgi:alkylated DNA repair dioxygenase AlkB